MQWQSCRCEDNRSQQQLKLLGQLYKQQKDEAAASKVEAAQARVKELAKLDMEWDDGHWQ